MSDDLDQQIDSLSMDHHIDSLGAAPSVPNMQQTVKYVAPDQGDEIDQAIDKFAAPVHDQALYGGPMAQSEALAAGIGNVLTAGLYTAAQKYLGKKSEEEIQGQKRANPWSYGLGQAIGAATGLGVMKLLAPVGEAALSITGLENAGTVGTRIAASAVRNAAEAALIEGTEESSKMFAGNYRGIDPLEAAQTAIGNIGMSALLGGGVGGLTGAGGEVWNKLVGGKVTNSLDNVQSALNEPVPEPGSAAAQAGAYKDALSKTVPNAKEIVEAAQRRGVELPEGSLSANQRIRDASQRLSEGQSLSALGHNQKYAAAHEALEKESLDLLKDRTAISEAEVGGKLKEAFKKDVEAELAPVTKAFKELEPKLKKIPVDGETIVEKIKPIVESDSLKFNKAAREAVSSELEELSKIQNVNDLKVYRTELNKRIADAHPPMGAPKPEAQALLQVKDVLHDIRDDALRVGAEAGVISPEDVAKYYAANDGYAAIKQKLQKAGVEAGLGNINNVDSLLKRFDKISNENFAGRFFDKNDVNQLLYFKENYPDLFNLSRRYIKSEMYEKSIDTATGKLRKFDYTKFLDQIEDKRLGPEARELLFPGMGQKIEDLKLIRSAIPGVVNPSGTSKALAIMKLFSKEGFMQNLSDAAQLAMLRAEPHLAEAIAKAGAGDAAEIAGLKVLASTKPADAGALKHMVEFIKETLRGENRLGRATKALFEGAEAVVPTKLIPTEKDKKKLDDRLKDLQSNNSPLFDIGGRVAHYMPEHGSAMAQTASQGVMYLNSIRPVVAKMSPLDADLEPSTAEKMKFDRALEIAEQPLVVLQSIKDGEITAHDINVLQNVYPALYTRMKKKISAEMMTAVHDGVQIPYRTRLSIAGFLGTTLDSTMTPSSIQAIQAGLQMASGKQDQKEQAMQQQALKGGGKSLENIVSQSQTPQQARQAHNLGMA